MYQPEWQWFWFLFLLDVECHPLSKTLGRCGPKWGGRCNKDLVDYAVYCNTENGWCGITDAHKNEQIGDEYDWEPKSCKGNVYILLSVKIDYTGINYVVVEFHDFLLNTSNITLQIAVLKEEGQSCGSCFCPPNFSAGECGPGLECIHDPRVSDLPGKCVLIGT